MTPTTAHQHIEFDHIGFVVPDLPDAVAFFIEHLGGSLEFQLDRFIDASGEAVSRLGAKKGSSFALAMLRLGATRIELLQWWPSTNSTIEFAPTVIGTAHLAIAVTDVLATIERLREVAGVTILSGPVTFDEGPTPGLTNAFLLTPWGLLVEVVSWGSVES